MDIFLSSTHMHILCMFLHPVALVRLAEVTPVAQDRGPKSTTLFPDQTV
jgi:hypothetical protein